MFEIFEHTADVGLRLRSPSMDRLIMDAGRGLFSMIAPNLSAVRPVLDRKIEVSGDEFDYLLFDWLNELLFVFDTEHLVFVNFEVQLADAHLVAVCHGEPFSAQRHGEGLELKAITYHGLKVEQQGSVWLAEVIVDI